MEATQGQVKAENSKSVKVIEDLLSKLTVSKSQDEINASSNDLASFVNGDIEEKMTPTKYVALDFLPYIAKLTKPLASSRRSRSSSQAKRMLWPVSARWTPSAPSPRTPTSPPPSSHTSLRSSPLS